jgi:hypothetical protein
VVLVVQVVVGLAGAVPVKTEGMLLQIAGVVEEVLVAYQVLAVQAALVLSL